MYFLYRDIKAQNLLLDENNKNIMVADFGLSEPDHVLTTFGGSLPYMAPEVLGHKPHNGTKSDIWSSGVILYLLMTGTYPFDMEDEERLKMEIFEADYRYE